MTETAVKPARAVRADNRLQGLLDAAARLFAERGYAATSTRDIALAADMLPGSLYYHFASKEQMLVAVYEAGVSELAAAVHGAIGREALPWSRLEAACRAHLETVLKHSDYAQVLIRVLPQDVPVVAERLGTLRAGYEAVWRELVAALPLPAGSDRRALRLMLLGSLNWARFWFDLQGRDSPRVLARKFVGMLKEAQEHG